MLLLDWDTQLFLSINALAGNWAWLDHLMRALSRPANFYIPGFFALAYWYWKKRTEAVVHAILFSL
jgi:hypothetical protein